MRHRKGSRFVRVAVAAILASAFFGSLAACSNSAEPEGPQTGTLSVSLVDAPAIIEDLEKLTVEFEQLWVHSSGDAESSEGGWFELLPDTMLAEYRTFDVLELIAGEQAVLGEMLLPVGKYTQIRLVLGAAWATIGEDSIPLATPSGTRTGVKLIHPFDILADQRTALILDFDARRSVIETPPESGNYTLKPVIRVETSADTGSIAGHVKPYGVSASIMAVSADLKDTLMTTVALESSNYVLAAVPPGPYDVTAWAAGYLAETDSDVVVRAGWETGGVDFILMEHAGP